jgi:dienelactone hydrolase
MSRNLSINQYFNGLSQRHMPRFRFGSQGNTDWKSWHGKLLEAARASLLKMPRRVPLNPQVLVEWEGDGLIKQRFVIDVEEGLAATGYLFRPKNASGRLPAILCCHGHGPNGKEAVMGQASDSAVSANIRELNYDYGLQMAKAGFVTIAIDWRGFGERDDRKSPFMQDIARGRDQCNVHFLMATMLGMTLLGMDIHDGQRTLDYLCEQPFVDPNRIGVMGLSFGGTMTTWMSLCDDRIKATDIIWYSDRFEQFAMRRANFCGSQMTPGLFDLCDVPDLQGLIAPRPLLVEVGISDNCFLADDAMSCYREVEKIYSAAGARERLELDLFQGGHAWGANKSVDFFRKHL